MRARSLVFLQIAFSLSSFIFASEKGSVEGGGEASAAPSALTPSALHHLQVTPATKLPDSDYGLKDTASPVSRSASAPEVASHPDGAKGIRVDGDARRREEGSSTSINRGIDASVTAKTVELPFGGTPESETTKPLSDYQTKQDAENQRVLGGGSSLGSDGETKYRQNYRKDGLRQGQKSLFRDVLSGSPLSGLQSSFEAALSGLENADCERDARMFLEGLRNHTLWSTQMFDASVKYPLGVLSGNVYNMGDFDECLSIRGAPVNGKYCLARVDIKEPPTAKELRLSTRVGGISTSSSDDLYTIWLNPLASMWEQIEYKGDRSKHRKDSVYWAMCLPSSCSAGDLEVVMNQVLPPLAADSGIDLNVNVHPYYCNTLDKKPFGSGEWAFCIVLLLIVLTSISATVCDSYLPKTISTYSAWGRIFLCFSMRKNFAKLPKIESNQDGLRIMFGIRVLSMVMVIMCHKYGVTIGGATTNGQYIEEGNRETPYMLTLHGDLVVDTFFAVGAFLLSYSVLKDCEAKKATSVPVMYFLRYVRLTPAYAIIIFFYATVLNRFGSGPLWNTTVAQESAFCATNWWANLLYVSNYVNTKEMCMVQSWYLPCDMHFFILGAPLATLLWKRPRLGKAALVAFALLTIIIPFAVTMAGRHDATLLFYRDFLANPRASRYFHAMYITSHTRAGAYAAGFLAGYLFYAYRLFETKISKSLCYAMFALSVAISFSVLFSGVVFYTPSNEYSPWEAATYAALQRFAWGGAICLLVVSVASGNIGIVSSILCWSPFVAMGKLTYCSYLIHFVFQIIGLGGDRTPNYVTNYNVFLKSTGESAFTFTMALILYLMVEAPFRDIGKLMILSARPRNSTSERRVRAKNDEIDKKTTKDKGEPIGKE